MTNEQYINEPGISTKERNRRKAERFGLDFAVGPQVLVEYLQRIERQEGAGMNWRQKAHRADSPEAKIILREKRGKVIERIEIRHDSLFLYLEDGTCIEVFDNGQDCCEARYMTCDDDLDWHGGRGARLVDISLRDVQYEEAGDDEEHEIQFVVIDTTLGSVTLCSHNQHNGYYGGFSMCLRVGRWT